jgi:hypothetical protein
MKRFTAGLQLFCRTALLLTLCCGWAMANPTSDQVERDRIAQARVQIQATHDKDMLQCKQEFAVTDCEQRVAKIKRARWDQLNREELVLKDQERKRKAAKQLKKLDERAKNRTLSNAPDDSLQSKQKIKIAKPNAVPAQSVDSEQARLHAENQSQAKYEEKLRAAQNHQEKARQSGQLRFKPGASLISVGVSGVFWAQSQRALSSIHARS